ncbi:MAG: hypothetical protein EXS03_06120 [Phycisphaerales bacterium]|nr:hypothetical protein [Phycisphaerales bacterium]
MNERDPFARESDGAPDHVAPDHVAADSAVVHGLLALLLPGEAARVQRRVDRAIDTIRRENGRFRLRVRQRVAWIGGSVGIAAAIVLAVFFVPSDSDSRAYAALESIRATAREGVRTYRITMELENSPSKGVSRAGELVLGPGGRWMLAFQPPSPPPNESGDESKPRTPRLRVNFGFNGTVYWLIDPHGEVRTAKSMRELNLPMFLGTLESGGVIDQGESVELEPLTLESMLAKLDRGYTTSFEPSPMESQPGDRPTMTVSFTRKGTAGRTPGPRHAMVVADAQTYEVLRAHLEWIDAGSQSGARMGPFAKRINLELLEGASRRPSSQLQQTSDWFEPEFHAKNRPSKPNQPAGRPSGRAFQPRP